MPCPGLVLAKTFAVEEKIEEIWNNLGEIRAGKENLMVY